MNNEVIPTRKPSASEKLLREKFTEEITSQPERLDALARQLLALELAVPGLYATALKLLHGKDATVTTGSALYITFGCWVLALLCAFLGLFPRKYEVDPTVIRRSEAAKREERLSIEEFFQKSTRYKYGFLSFSAAFFVIGVIAAIWELF